MGARDRILFSEDAESTEIKARWPYFVVAYAASWLYLFHDPTAVVPLAFLNVGGVSVLFLSVALRKWAERRIADEILNAVSEQGPLQPNEIAKATGRSDSRQLRRVIATLGCMKKIRRTQDGYLPVSAARHQPA